VNLEACLPADLQGPSTTITKIAAGLSGAGVYRVESSGQAYVLKVAGVGEPAEAWRRKLHIQQLAANAGLAPRVVHVDEARRAVVSAFVVDLSFPAFYGNPNTRDAAVTLLGKTLRRLHDLPQPPENSRDARDFISTTWSQLESSFAVPPFVGDTVRRVLAEEPPASDRSAVLCHNDVNPTNLVYDGERLLLLDWETAGVNDPFYDLAAISVFARMDEATCRRMLEAYDDQPVAQLPARLGYNRRLVAAFAGTIFLRLAQYEGHAGTSGGETLDSTVSLVDFYQQMRSGAVSIATAEGKWLFGLSLLKESAAL
jgi:thiamine kinase-like enzyme